MSEQTNRQHEKAIIFGGGNVGRGFLGQLFTESGYGVTFVDIDEPLIEALCTRGSYTIRLVDNEHTQEVQVGPVTGLLSSSGQAVAQAVAEATLGATAVGARVLKYVAPLLARGITLRAEGHVQEPLNIIVCENLKGAASHLRGLVSEHLGPAALTYLDEYVGFVETVIGRMVPELDAALRAQDPSLIIVEPYKELPVDRSGFVGPIPKIVGMEPHDDFALFTARKLYLHNAGHALLGYLGYRRGHTLGYEALEDPEVRPILDAALEESLQGIVTRFDAAEDWLRDHVADLLRRFANRALADPIVRLARDPLRKLAPTDRLVGAARLAEAAGPVPVNLAWAIAGALAYDESSDPIAVELQQRITEGGPASVLQEVCEIRAEEPLRHAILERYQRLRTEARWR